jgi:serine/threonine protein kinase
MERFAHPRQIHQYTITSELGQGAFSLVCRAFNRQTRRSYAIKIFPKANLTSTGDSDRFQREINSCAFMRHENLVALHDFFWDDLNFYMVLDLCAGGELFDYIIKHSKLDEPLAALILKQMVFAVSYCHSLGVAHRDLKPENILIEKFPRIKISDFGLCGFISADRKMDTFCGSPTYCAPECLSKTTYQGELSDIWSLGVILYCMVTGNNPWTVSNVPVMMNQIFSADYPVPDFLSAECADLLSRMLRVTPEQRIALSDILSHPWIQKASLSPVQLPLAIFTKKGAPAPPCLNGASIEDVSSLSKSSCQSTSQGVYSPFESKEEEEETDETVKKPQCLPQLIVRADAIVDFQRNQQKRAEAGAVEQKPPMFTWCRHRNIATAAGPGRRDPKSADLLPRLTG